MIRKLSSGKYRLYSRKRNSSTGKRRNLGTFRTAEAAKRHERGVHRGRGTEFEAIFEADRKGNRRGIKATGESSGLISSSAAGSRVGMNSNPRVTACALGALFALILSARAQTPATIGQVAKVFEQDITTKVRLEYLLSLPADYEKSDKPWPLVLFLHGAGESGHELSKVKAHGPPKLVERKGPFPFILVSPQCPGRGWSPEVLNALLDSLVKEYRVDKDRVYLTGLSMGGFGTWSLAAAHPEKFAAIAPICGGGNPADAPKLAKLPIWVFHGGKDPVVPLRRSEEMVEALKVAGGAPKFTVYPDAGHDSWTATYDNPEFYQWLLAQKRSAK
jgi:poly(3-hydroxybutyrate) depolymerase